MKCYRFFHKETGNFHPSSVVINVPENEFKKSLEANCPNDHIPIAGIFDNLSQRIDITSGRVVDWKPDPPTERHQWDESIRRWLPNQDDILKESKRKDILDAIDKLENRALRPQREILIDPDNIESRSILENLNTQIQDLRKELVV